jgi:hypothetical protein
MAVEASHRRTADTLAGSGEMSTRMRGFDWTDTALGAPENWPRSLKTAARIMLTSRQPMWIGWGRDLIFLYNDPYKSIIGGNTHRRWDDQHQKCGRKSGRTSGRCWRPR